MKNLLPLTIALVSTTPPRTGSGSEFTVSPRGAWRKMGTGNYTIMLDPDYIELLGVLVETEHNTPTRAFLAKRGEGIKALGSTAVNSAAAAIRAREYATRRT